VKRREFITLRCGGMAARGARAARRADAPDRNFDAVPADKRGNAGAGARLPRGAAKTWLGGERQRPVRRALDQRQHGLRSLRSRNLVELNPDVILASGARVVPILMELTRSIPIVTPSASDVIERGHAGGLARPGGNVTGFGSIEPSIVGKMLQTLKEIAPNVACFHDL
jgi:ABC transporter substrate binding protein